MLSKLATVAAMSSAPATRAVTVSGLAALRLAEARSRASRRTPEALIALTSKAARRPMTAKLPAFGCGHQRRKTLTGADGRLPGNLAVGISYIEPERAPIQAQAARVRAGHGASPNDTADERPAPGSGLNGSFRLGRPRARMPA